MREDRRGAGFSAATDPLRDPAFKAPGIFENLRDLLLGSSRPLACLQIEVTSCCQSRCAYCPRAINADTWQARHMSPAVFARLWPLLRRARRAHLQGWGEPLLNPHFFEFQAFATKAGCATSTTTCGMVMDSALARKLAACGLDIIAFSLAGTDSESNQARARAPFDQVCANIRLLQEEIAKLPDGERPELHFAYLLLPDQLEALNRLPALMESLDIACAVISTLDYLADPAQAKNAFAPGQGHEKALQALSKAAKEASEMGRAIHYSLPRQGARNGGCRENIAASAFASAQGDISPCVYLNVPDGRPEATRITFGNCLDKDAWEIWVQEDFQQFRESLAQNRPQPACASCPKRHEGEQS